MAPVHSQHTLSLTPLRHAYEEAHRDYERWNDRLRHNQNPDIDDVLHRKVGNLKAEDARTRQALIDARLTLAVRIIEAEGVTDPTPRVKRLGELELEPDWRLEWLAQGLRQLEQVAPPMADEAPARSKQRGHRRGKFLGHADFQRKLRDALFVRCADDKPHAQTEIAGDLGCSVRALGDWLAGKGRYPVTDWGAEVRAAEMKALHNRSA